MGFISPVQTLDRSQATASSIQMCIVINQLPEDCSC
jgi:hypothetical protein